MLRSNNVDKDLFKECVDAGVFKETKKTGRHYLLSNTNHTHEFFDFAAGFKNAEFRRIMGSEVMEELGRLRLSHEVDVIITPAIGGLLLCGTMQHLFRGEKPVLVYTEKINGVHRLCRNFELKPNQRVLVFDDACNSGESLAALKKICDSFEAMVVAMGALVNRSPSGVPGFLSSTIIPTVFLISYPIQEFTPEECKRTLWCSRAVPLEKDGKLVDNEGNVIESAKPVDENIVSG